MQFAVSSAEMEVLIEVDSLKNSFLKYLNKGKSNPTLKVEQLDFIEKTFNEYYPLARKNTQQMIDGELGEKWICSLSLMQLSKTNFLPRITRRIKKYK